MDDIAGGSAVSRCVRRDFGATRALARTLTMISRERCRACCAGRDQWPGPHTTATVLFNVCAHTFRFTHAIRTSLIRLDGSERWAHDLAWPVWPALPHTTAPGACTVPHAPRRGRLPGRQWCQPPWKIVHHSSWDSFVVTFAACSGPHCWRCG